jgi:hypothetical protein
MSVPINILCKPSRIQTGVHGARRGGPKPNGATYRIGGTDCYAEYGMNAVRIAWGV